MNIIRLENFDIRNKRLLIRMDLNVPVSGGKITSVKRIDAVLDSLRYVVSQGARTMIMSHLGRPVEGRYDEQYSLLPIAGYLSEKMDFQIPLINDYLEGEIEVGCGKIVLLENVRFNLGEIENCHHLSQKYADLCDIFVMNAFGAAHRAQASTYGVGLKADSVCCGALLANELEALGCALEEPRQPTVAIVGGAKVSTKISVLTNFLDKFDQLIPGGGIANNFIVAAGHNIGKSLCEPSWIAHTQDIIRRAKEQGKQIPIPIDVLVGKSFSADTKAEVKKISEVADDDMIFDIGPKTIEHYKKIMETAGTVVWNGPIGVFEFDQFSHGTQALVQSIAENDCFSVAGGGDTIAVIEKFGLTTGISYISTGGGAFLEFLEGKKLPAVEMLEYRANM